MESLEREVDNLRQVDNLRHCVENLLCELRRRESAPAPLRERLVKTFLKPRDIPVLELRQLNGVDGAERRSFLVTGRKLFSVNRTTTNSSDT